MPRPLLKAWDVVATRVSEAAAARPPAAWSSACLYLVACALLLAGSVTVPMDARIAHPTDAILAGLCAVMAGVTWFAGRRLGWILPHLVVVFGIAVITVAVAVSRTFGGVIFPAFGYLWTAVYFAYFHTRRVVFAYVVLIAAAFGVALGIAQVDEGLAAWIVVMASVVTLALLLHALVNLLAQQAEQDPLTRTLNRKGLDRQAGTLRASWARRRSPATVALIDLDDFKAVNDRVGHVEADELLVDLVGHWRSRLRASDLVARVGGDEFVLLLGETQPDAAETLLSELRRGSPLEWSVGTTTLLPGEPLETALGRADANLYMAKHARGHEPVAQPDSEGSADQGRR